MRQITVTVSSQSYFEPDALRIAVIQSLSSWVLADQIGPASVSTGTALFLPALRSESQCTVTLHEARPRLAILVWHRLRNTLKNVDCGRIVDRRLSWCAKAYENESRENPGRWPRHHFAPIEC